MAQADDGDLRLAAAVAAGDQAAARRLCERYLPRVFGYILRRTGLGPDTAAELAQETVVAALRSIQHYGGRSSLDTWLCALARHKVADHYRRESRRPASLDDLALRGLELFDQAPLPQEVAERDELAEAVHRAVWLLPPAQRDAVLGKYLDGLSLAELAREMGRTEKAVESLLSRARATLRRMLAAWAEG